jgi:hypothetical protein
LKSLQKVYFNLSQFGSSSNLGLKVFESLAFKIKSLFEKLERIVLQLIFLFLSFLAQKGLLAQLPLGRHDPSLPGPGHLPHLLPLASDTIVPSLGRPRRVPLCASGHLLRTGPDVSRPPPPPFPSLNRCRLLFTSPSITSHHLQSAPPPPSLPGRPPPRLPDPIKRRNTPTATSTTCSHHHPFLSSLGRPHPSSSDHRHPPSSSCRLLIARRC